MDIASKYEDVVAKLDAVTAALAKANEKIDQAWNRSSELDYQGFIPGALDAWKRPVKQNLPYDFSGNPGASATQYCNGWNDSGSYWSAHAKDLQQRLTVAEQLLSEALCHAQRMEPISASLFNRIDEAIGVALKPAEEVARCMSCDSATVEQCDDAGCGFLGAGNGAPAAEGEGS